MPTQVKSRISRNGKSAAAPTEEVTIPAIDVRSFKVKLVGTAPLIVHRFTEKAKTAIQDKQAKKAAKAREQRDPKAEYLAACYVFPGCQAGDKKCVYGVPARAIKAATVDACRFVNGLPMTVARRAFHIDGDDGGDLVKLHYSEMRMREDPVRLPNGNLDLRYRPEFSGWSLVVTIRYNAATITPEQIIGLMSHGGFHCGLLEDRPGSKSGPGGSHGTFEVQTA